MRVVETWMGEWKEHFYNHKPYLRGQKYGDISKQLALKERLQCKNFTWFLTEIAPDILQHYPPVEPDPGAQGYVSRNLWVRTWWEGVIGDGVESHCGP